MTDDTQKEEIMTEAQKKQPANQVVEMEPANLPAAVDTGSSALMRMIEKAMMDPAFDVAKMEHLLAVKERWDATEARKAFVLALAAFKADPPRIVKDKTVSFGEGRGRTEYEHATLAQVCTVIGKALAEHGLSHTWEVHQHEDTAVEVTCVLTHVLGHAERVTMRGMPDASGSKNQIQQVASTVTYLQRYSLLSATGLAAGEDTDGAGPVEFISAEQKETLIELMKEVEADTVRFLRHLNIKTLDDLPVARFGEAVNALEAKRKAKE